MEWSDIFTLYLNFSIENKYWFTGHILKAFMKNTFKYTSKRKNLRKSVIRQTLKNANEAYLCL